MGVFNLLWKKHVNQKKKIRGNFIFQSKICFTQKRFKCCLLMEKDVVETPAAGEHSGTPWAVEQSLSKANFIQKCCSEGSFLQVIHSWLLVEILDEKSQEFVKFIWKLSSLIMLFFKDFNSWNISQIQNYLVSHCITYPVYLIGPNRIILFSELTASCFQPVLLNDSCPFIYK